MYVLGISCFFHDAAACLIRDGRIVAAVEEERFTGRKHDDRFPVEAIRYCLGEAGIAPGEVDHVAFYEKPLLKFERLLASQIASFPASRAAFVRSMETWLVDKLWTRGRIVRELRPRSPIVFGEHHVSHAASAFFASPFAEAAVLTADGVGEWTTTAVGIGSGTSLELQREIRFPHSLGLLYSAFTRHLGFEVNEGEYKVMGLAAYGTPRYVDRVRRIVDVAADGSFRMDMRVLAYDRALRLYGRQFVDLFGPERRPDDEIEERHADIAASAQVVLEDALLRAAIELRKRTGAAALCMAGGVALNGLANTRILREAGFRDLFVQPAAGDSGAAFGVAAFVHHSLLGHPRVPPMEHAYLGPGYDDDAIRAFLDAEQLPAARLTDADLVDAVAAALAEGQVVGWFRGRMEFGPRALGARSILADPTRPEMKDLVNAKIKLREPFRPFGPSVTAEDAHRFFDVMGESPFMLQIVPVRAEMRSKLPAITHADGTARIQTVRRHVNPVYYDLLRAFERRRGVPVLLNTSFNVRGQPIVRTPAEAVACFARTDLDQLVLGNHVLRADAKAHIRWEPAAGEAVRRDEVVF